MTDYIVPISKAKRGLKVTGEMVNGLFEEVFHAIIAEGLKVHLNKNMAKFKVRDVEDDEEELEKLREDAFEQANENLKALVEGELGRKRKAGTTKEPRAVVTRARQITRDKIKASYRAAGKKINAKQSELTAMADELLADADYNYIWEQARKDVAEANAKKASAIEIKKGSILADMIAASDDLKPKGEGLKRAREAKASAGTVAAASKLKGTSGKVQPAARH
jgi:hypothetical protein